MESKMKKLDKIIIASAFATGFTVVGCILSTLKPTQPLIDLPTKSGKPAILQPLKSHVLLKPIEIPKFVGLGSTDISKKISNINGVLQFGSVKIPQGIVVNVVKAARKAKVDPALLMAIAEKESNFKIKAKASTSSATGLFQFIDKTWMKAVKQFGNGYNQVPRERILGLRADPYLSALFAAKMLKKDGEELADKIGRKLTAGETYLIHFLGPEDAEKFMKTVETSPDMSAAQLFPKPAHANKPIFYARVGKSKTIAQVHDAFESMMGIRFKKYENVASKLPKGVLSYTD